jgi:hypothetical protein
MRFGSGFAELEANLDADTCSIFLSITNKTKDEVEKALT